jgi:hypothetical protein
LTNHQERKHGISPGLKAKFSKKWKDTKLKTKISFDFFGNKC